MSCAVRPACSPQTWILRHGQVRSGSKVAIRACAETHELSLPPDLLGERCWNAIPSVSEDTDHSHLAFPAHLARFATMASQFIPRRCSRNASLTSCKRHSSTRDTVAGCKKSVHSESHGPVDTYSTCQYQCRRCGLAEERWYGKELSLQQHLYFRSAGPCF